MKEIKKCLTYLGEYDKAETILKLEKEDAIILAKEEKIGNIIEKIMYYGIAICTLVILVRNLLLWLTIL